MEPFANQNYKCNLPPILRTYFNWQISSEKHRHLYTAALYLYWQCQNLIPEKKGHDGDMIVLSTKWECDSSGDLWKPNDGVILCRMQCNSRYDKVALIVDKRGTLWKLSPLTWHKDDFLQFEILAVRFEEDGFKDRDYKCNPTITHTHLLHSMQSSSQRCASCGRERQANPEIRMLNSFKCESQAVSSRRRWVERPKSITLKDTYLLITSVDVKELRNAVPRRSNRWSCKFRCTHCLCLEREWCWLLLNSTPFLPPPPPPRKLSSATKKQWTLELAIS